MTEISKAYEPQAVEEKWYARWLEEGCFTGNAASAKPAYSMVIPPPNVTGVLTLGHVLNNTIQDILARRARMLGKEVLWLPGTDHAGIATQNVVERQLRKEGKTRHDLGREEFLKLVWEWKDEARGDHHPAIEAAGVLVRLDAGAVHDGCGLLAGGDGGIRRSSQEGADLSREPDGELGPDGADGALGRGGGDAGGKGDAVLFQSRGGGGAGAIFDDRDDAAGDDTRATRPIAVNPNDGRYGAFIGKHAVRPLPAELPREQKLIPIIGDTHVEFEFGTGVLKVTPAHDKADFEIGARHGLPVIDIMNPDGVMNALAGEDLAGLDRFEAREAAVGKLEELQAMAKQEAYTHSVGFSERTHVPVEPRLSEQWFLRYPALDESARGGAQRRGGVPARAVGGGVRALDGENPGLVHLAAALVGASHPGVVLEEEPGRGSVRGNRAAGGQRELGAGPRTCSTRGFHRGCGRSRRWTRRRG